MRVTHAGNGAEPAAGGPSGKPLLVLTGEF